MIRNETNRVRVPPWLGIIVAQLIASSRGARLKSGVCPVYHQQSPTSPLRDEGRTNRGLQIAEANPDVDRCDGRAEAHPYRAEKNGFGP
jgi:hypothetical protein